MSEEVQIFRPDEGPPVHTPIGYVSSVYFHRLCRAVEKISRDLDGLKAAVSRIEGRQR